MRSIARSFKSPPMVVAFIALLAALCGTAVALPGSNTVTSDDIRNGAVKTQDIRNSTVRGADVRNNTLTGSDVNEGSLGTVPRASVANSANSAGFANTALAANTANSVGGVALRTINFQRNGNVGNTVVFNAAGLTLTANCDSGDLDVVASTAVSGSQLQSSSEDTSLNTIDNAFVSDGFGADSPQDLVFEDDVTQNGKTEFSTPAGNGASITWAADEGVGTGPDCEFTGHALVH